MHLQIEKCKFYILVVIKKGDCYLHHICPSARLSVYLYQCYHHRTDFCEI